MVFGRRAETPMDLRATALRRLIFWWMAVIVWMAAIFILSNTTQATLADTSEFVSRLLPRLLLKPTFVHPFEFGVLSILVYRLLSLQGAISARPRLFLVTILVTLGYGVIDEIHQLFVTGRSSSIADLGADALGIAIGLAVVAMLIRVRAALRSRRQTGSRATAKVS